MRKLTTLCSAISLVLLHSCGRSTVENFSRQPLDKAIFTNSYFADPTIDYVYKAQISAYGNDFGGIFITKKINDSTHRAVFTTEFGNSIFDFDISPTHFKVNSIIDALDKKIIVNTLKRDFRLLLQQRFEVNQQYSTQDTLVYQSNDGARFNYLYTTPSEPRLLKLVHATKSRNKIIIKYLVESSTLANNIIIDHNNIKLRIELNRLITN